MTDLKDIQKSFIQDCLSGQLQEGNISMEPEIDQSTISAKGRMGIYRESAIGNITNAMELTYPVTVKLVGEKFFAATCRKYIEQHWPESGNMDDYGQDFADFLAQFEPAKTLPYLPDVAWLEWLWHRSSIAPECQTIDQTAIANIPQDKYFSLRLTPHASANLLHSKYPVSKIWEMNQDGAECRKVNLEEEPEEFLLVIRHGLKTDIMRLIPAEHTFLSALIKGENFYDAFEAAITTEEDFDLAYYVHKHISGGTFSGFAVG